jgi:hypothetical protein
MVLTLPLIPHTLPHGFPTGLPHYISKSHSNSNKSFFQHPGEMRNAVLGCFFGVSKKLKN